VTLADTARAHYAAQASLVQRVQRVVLGLWAGLDVTGLTASWAALRLGERLFVALAAGQLAAAAAAPRYVAAAVQRQGATSTPVGSLVPRALAGVASDGRNLETLLFEPVVRVKSAIRDGASTARAMEMGRSSLATIAGTEVADAGRAGVAVAMAVEPAVTGWVRMLVPPSCGRCAILAGRRYRYSDGFRRHFSCDCVHIPLVEDTTDDLRTDPQAYFQGLSRQDQDKYFGKSNTAAILNGADMGRVVNVGRSTSIAGGGPRRSNARVMPAQINAEATNRDDAVQSFRRYGFVL
jgi:hypothetical protein